MQEKNSVGKAVDFYCGKCNLNVDHTIVEMAGEAIAEVTCKSCGSSHRIGDPLAVKKVRKPRAKKDAKEAAEIAWTAGLEGAKGKERDYSMASKYRIGEIVNHQIFGKGIVMKLYVNKCDMLFKDRERLMASTNG
jgi:transcription elongation factor Elf1